MALLSLLFAVFCKIKSKGRVMLTYSKDEIRELQYWATKVKGVSVDDAKSLDEHLCNLLDIRDPEPIEDPDL